MTLIDTSAWVEFFRRQGNPDVKQRVAACIELGEAAVCGPIRFELLAGARGREDALIDEAFGFCTDLDFTTTCWKRAAVLERTLRARGITMPRDDIFVAASALEHGALLLTCDAHFERIRDGASAKLRLVGP